MARGERKERLSPLQGCPSEDHGSDPVVLLVHTAVTHHCEDCCQSVLRCWCWLVLTCAGAVVLRAQGEAEELLLVHGQTRAPLRTRCCDVLSWCVVLIALVLLVPIALVLPTVADLVGAVDWYRSSWCC